VRDKKVIHHKGTEKKHLMHDANHSDNQHMHANLWREPLATVPSPPWRASNAWTLI
jgi:hypothetical protein